MLNWGDEVFIGQERYANLLKRSPDLFETSLFQGNRFATIAPGDCGYATFEEGGDWNVWYAAKKDPSAYEQYSVVGDKITGLYEQYSRFADSEWIAEDIRIVQILRKPQDVVASYERRRLDSSDNWDKGFAEGIADWVTSIRVAAEQYRYRSTRFRFHVVLYESLFGDGPEKMIRGGKKLFETLDLEFGVSQLEGLNKMYQNTLARKEKRTSINAEWESTVNSRIDGETHKQYEYLKDLALFL
jgi:hypothetical protein